MLAARCQRPAGRTIGRVSRSPGKGGSSQPAAAPSRGRGDGARARTRPAPPLAGRFGDGWACDRRRATRPAHTAAEGCAGPPMTVRVGRPPT